MSQVVAKRFSCAGCGKSYGWKPELSNKRARCACGREITIPDLSEPEPVSFEDGPPSLAALEAFEEAADIAPPVRPMPARAVARPAAVARPKPKTLNYGGGPPRAKPRRRSANGLETDMVRDVWVPAGLVGASFAVLLIAMLSSGKIASGTSAGLAGTVLALLLVVQSVVMVGLAFVVAAMTGVSFGPFKTALLKLSAVFTAPEVIAGIIQGLAANGDAESAQARLIGGLVSLAVYAGLLTYLFRFTVGETIKVVIAFVIVRILLTIVLAVAFAAIFVSLTHH